MTYPSTTLGKLCIDKPQYGANAKAIARTSESQPRYIRITDIDANGQLIPNGVAADVSDTSTYSLREGDLLIARSGNTVGKSYLHPKGAEPSLFAGYLIRFQLSPKRINPRFAFFFTKSERYNSWLDSKRRVAGQPNINGTEYASLEIPLPPLPEQDRIVEILDQAYALRRQRRDADELSKRILPALFDEMFGGAINTTRLDEAAKFMSGGTPSKSNDSFWKGDIPWISPKDMKFKVITSSIDKISELALKESATNLIPSQSILVVVRSGILAHSFPIAITGCPVAINQDIKALIPSEGFTAEFIDGYFQANIHLALSCVKRGATVHNIDVPKLRALLIPKPAQEKQNAFVTSYRNLLKQNINAAISAETLETLFQTLLHRAFDGRLTAKWRESHAKELLQEMEHHSKR